MTQITKTDIWAALVFQGTKWSDNNRDGLIQKDEFRPALTRPENAEFDKIDRDKNGILSTGEVQIFVSAKGVIDQNIGLDAVIAGLKADGIYKVKGGSTAFMRDDKVPTAALNDPIMGEMIRKNIQAGNAISVGFTLKGESLNPLVSDGEGRVAMIIIPSAKLDSAPGQEMERLKDIMKHEVVHTRQMLQGRTNEVTYFKSAMVDTGIIFPNMIVPIYEKINAALGEGEAYLKSIIPSIERGDVDQVLKHTERLNYFVATLNLINDKFEEAKAGEHNPLLNMFREEYLPKNDVAAVNAKLSELAAKNPEKAAMLKIYEGIRPPEYRRIFTEGQK